MINWNKKPYHTTTSMEKNGVVWIEFLKLQELNHEMGERGFVHAYSTRIGGVSSGCTSSMNLRLCEYDTFDNYKENIKKFCEAINVPMNRITASHQTHTTNLFVVRETDFGYGNLFSRQLKDIDGLVTNVPNIPLFTSFADCIPLYFIDPVHYAIGVSHGGWRGTVNLIAEKTIKLMQQEYQSEPKDIYCAIGPGICKDCYEISEDVYLEFLHQFGDRISEIASPGIKEGKYQLDLWNANRIVMEQAGILPEHITITDICTKCNSDYLFSHRVMGSRRGNQCAVLMLK